MKGLQSVIQILQETADKFRKLYLEANIALSNRDVVTSENKLRERAQLIIELPRRLSDAIKGVEEDIAQLILCNVVSFAALAQHQKGSKDEDPNNLEKLITLLKEKEKEKENVQ